MQQHLKYDSKAVEKKAKQVLVINRGTDTIILKFDRLGNRGVHSRRMKATINAIRMLFPKEAKDGTLRYDTKGRTVPRVYKTGKAPRQASRKHKAAR